MFLFKNTPKGVKYTLQRWQLIQSGDITLLHVHTCIL